MSSRCPFCGSVPEVYGTPCACPEAVGQRAAMEWEYRAYRNLPSWPAPAPPFDERLIAKVVAASSQPATVQGPQFARDPGDGWFWGDGTPVGGPPGGSHGGMQPFDQYLRGHPSDCCQDDDPATARSFTLMTWDPLDSTPLEQRPALVPRQAFTDDSGWAELGDARGMMLTVTRCRDARGEKSGPGWTAERLDRWCDEFREAWKEDGAAAANRRRCAALANELAAAGYWLMLCCDGL